MRKPYGDVMSVAVLAAGLLVAGRALAGSLDPTNAPADPGSAMYTLGDIYHRLDSGAPGAKRAGGFVDPTNAPGGTGYSLDAIMAKAPATNENAATSGDVLSGKAYWSQKSGEWGPQTGTIETRTLSPANDTVAAGYYAATNLAAVDTDLATANIKSGANLFGVTGTPEVVDTASGDAVAGDVKSGKKAWVDGAEVTGMIPTLTLSDASTVVNAGYYATTNLAQVDTDLATANIKAGMTVFGITGTPAVVDTSSGDAVAGDMLLGKTAYVNGSEITGNVPAGVNLNGADGSLAITISNGLYSGSKTATAGDTDLVTGNIRSGANIFGVAGDVNVVDTSSGDAVASDVKAGKTAFVGGAEVTGTIPTRTLSVANDTVAEGY